MCFYKCRCLHSSLRSSLCCKDWGNFGFAGRWFPPNIGTHISCGIKSPGQPVGTCLIWMRLADSVYGCTQYLKGQICWSVSVYSGRHGLRLKTEPYHMKFTTFISFLLCISATVTVFPTEAVISLLVLSGLNPAALQTHFSFGLSSSWATGMLAPGLKDSWRSWNF